MNYIPYLGNKSKYVPKIHSLISSRLNNAVFIEPFGGSGSISLYMSKYVKHVFFNEIDTNIFNIHNSFKNGTYTELNAIIEEVWGFGDPHHIKEDFYTARNELNKKYFGSNTLSEGFFNWVISTFAINSMVRFGPNGFNSAWGNRGVGRLNSSKKMNLEKFNEIKKCYENIELYNEDFTTFMDRFNEGILFVDPPYIDMHSGTYTFSKTQYQNFLKRIKEWKDDVIYTDIFSVERHEQLGDGWNYVTLRDNIGSGNVGKNKREQRSEGIYYNFYNNHKLW